MGAGERECRADACSVRSHRGWRWAERISGCACNEPDVLREVREVREVERGELEYVLGGGGGGSGHGQNL